MMDLSLSALIITIVVVIIFLEIFLIYKSNRSKRKFKEIENILLWILSFREDYNSNQIPAIPNIDKLLRRNLGSEVEIKNIHFGNYKATHDLTSVNVKENSVNLKLLLRFPRVTVDINPENSFLSLHNLASEIEVEINKLRDASSANGAIYDTNITSVKPISCNKVSLTSSQKTKSEKKELEQRIRKILGQTIFNYSYQLKVTKFEEDLSNKKPLGGNEKKPILFDRKAKEIVDDIIPQLSSNVTASSAPSETSFLCPQNTKVTHSIKGHVLTNYVIEPIKRSKFTLSQAPLKSEVERKPSKKSFSATVTQQAPAHDSIVTKERHTTNKSSSPSGAEKKFSDLVVDSERSKFLLRGFHDDPKWQMKKPVNSQHLYTATSAKVYADEMPTNLVPKWETEKIRVGNLDPDGRKRSLYGVAKETYKNSRDPTYESTINKTLDEDEKIVDELDKDLEAYKKKAPLAETEELDFNDKEFVNSFPIKSFTKKEEKHINFMLDPLDQSSWNHSIIDDKVNLKTVRMDNLLPRSSNNKGVNENLEIMAAKSKQEIVNDHVYQTEPKDQHAYIPTKSRKGSSKKSNFLTKTVPCLFNEKSQNL